MSFASGRIILVAVLPQTGDKGVSGMRSLPSDIPQDAPRPFSKAAGESEPEEVYSQVC